jgi:hypothetical protein
VLPVTLDANGNIQYDAIVKQDGKNKVFLLSFSPPFPKQSLLMFSLFVGINHRDSLKQLIH